MYIIAIVACGVIGSIVGRIFYTFAFRPWLRKDTDLLVGIVGGLGGGLIYQWLDGSELLAAMISAFLGAFIILATLRYANQGRWNVHEPEPQRSTQPFEDFNN